MFATEYPEFTTVTCLEWKQILESDGGKDIVIESMRFLVKEARVALFAFVIMSNHFHLIWQVMGKHKRDLRNDNSSMLSELLVQAKDRRYQMWERNSLNIPLWSKKVTDQSQMITSFRVRDFI